MSEILPTPPDAPDRNRHLPWLLLLFAGSGCAALIYEIVWFQLLQLVIGSTAVSLGVLLGTYMGGMGAGSLLAPRVRALRGHPLRVYAALEAGIGALGLAVLCGMPQVSQMYAALVGAGWGGILLRGVFSAACLLPPTLLMGATLPIAARWVKNTPEGVAWLGFFYGGNIAGAVAGCLLAGFYLLRVYDMAVATYVAVALNAAVAALGWGLAWRTPWPAAEREAGRATSRTTSGAGFTLAHLAIGLSGFTALGAEVVWTRLLSLILGGTVYAFAVILSVFLAGLGLGSAAGAAWARTARRPQLALGLCQLGLVAAVAWAAHMLEAWLPYWPLNPELARSPWLVFQVDLSRALWAVLPAAVCWGASFPLALRAAARPGQDAGRLVAGVYAANTLGAIIGALSFSLVVLPWGGTQAAQRLLIAVAAASTVVMLAPACWEDEAEGASSRPRVGASLGLLGALALAAWLGRGVPPLPGGLVAYGRYLATWTQLPDILYVGEGMNSVVAVTQFPGGERNFHVSGKVEASTEPQDMRLQRMLGHLPALLHPAPRTVLVVGCGAGITAGTFLTYPSVERIVICEIEPLIPRVVAQYFGQENEHVVDDIDRLNPHRVNGKEVEVVYDDGRHYLLTTREKFDIITSDPIHPWVKGSATLYTQEYFELCRDHLRPGGFVTQWVPLYESNREAVRSELKTFLAVFPDGLVFSNDVNGAGYDEVMLGRNGPAGINVDAIETRFRRPDYRPVRDSLEAVGFDSALDLLSTYAGQGHNYTVWLADAEVNRDRNLRLQYLAGLGLNENQSDAIYQELLHLRTFPTALFTGSAQNLATLREALASTTGFRTPPPNEDSP
jgi:spermidine synthase